MLNHIHSEVQTVMAELVKVAAERRMSMIPFVRNHLKVSTRIDEDAQELVCLLTSIVLGKHEGRIDYDAPAVDVEEKYPEDWWQAFRERWLPRWWLKRYPVVYQTISVHRPKVSIHEQKIRVCPHLDIMVRDNQSHYQFLAQG